MAREAELVEAAKRVFSSPFDGVLRIEPEGAPAIWIDGRAAPETAMLRVAGLAAGRSTRRGFSLFG